ncbi:MAG: hypothetical protein ACLFTE_02355 [Salinivenus sp.]
MAPDATRRSKDEWKARFQPHLSTSLQTVSERLTNAPAVQSWLRKASTKAAEGLQQSPGLQGEMRGYMDLTQDLEATFPALVDAVRETTDGCGRLDLDWRPFNPTLSRLYIAFDLDVSVALFCRLSDCSPEAAREALDTVAAALPEGDPFPNRPNAVTGLVAQSGSSLGVRVKEHRDPDRGKYRTVTLLPKERSPLESLSPSEAERALLQFFCSSSRS